GGARLVERFGARHITLIAVLREVDADVHAVAVALERPGRRGTDLERVDVVDLQRGGGTHDEGEHHAAGEECPEILLHCCSPCARAVPGGLWLRRGGGFAARSTQTRRPVTACASSLHT